MFGDQTIGDRMICILYVIPVSLFFQKFASLGSNLIDQVNLFAYSQLLSIGMLSKL